MVSDGIHGSGTAIVGNTVSSNGGYGIHDFVSSSIANNNVTNNTQDGISSVTQYHEQQRFLQYGQWN
jgi:parallel beta-helix repeat protein